MRIYFFIVIPILISLLLYVCPLKISRIPALVLQFFLLVASFVNFYDVAKNGVVYYTTGGQGILGISLYFDKTASVFLMLTTLIFFCALLYTLSTDALNKMFVFLMVILESLIIIGFSSGDLFNLFVVIEVATIICATLIMFNREKRSIYDGLLYLLTNIVGMQFFLFGIGMIYKKCGVLSLFDLEEAILSDPKGWLLPYALLMTGIGLKAAMAPVMWWLPKAHGTPGAPSVVSAMLSGLYVKLGIYLFIRMRGIFFSAVNMDSLFLGIAVLTGVTGIVFAITQSQLKLILAYHTVSQMGLVLIGICLDNKYAYGGAMLHIVNHALFKSLLFLCAGMIMDVFKTGNVYQIHGVFKRLPLVAVAVIFGVLGITGAPFFNGSISKYFITLGSKGLWAEFALLLINLGTVVSFTKLIFMLPEPKSSVKGTLVQSGVGTQVKISVSKAIVLILLSSLCLLTGLLGEELSYLLFDLPIKVSLFGYIQKSLLWIGFCLVGFLTARLLTKVKVIKKGIYFELSFNAIVAMLVGFFAIIVSAGLFYYKL